MTLVYLEPGERCLWCGTTRLRLGALEVSSEAGLRVKVRHRSLCACGSMLREFSDITILDPT